MPRSVKVVISADIGDLKAKLREGATAVRGFTGELDRAGKKGNLDAVAHQAGAAGLALTGMAAYAIKSAADFDRAMSGVSAATHAPAVQIEALRAAAIKAGKDTQYSATEAAQGITELSKAGVGTADILGGGLKGALALAAAGQMSVADAAETAASALTQFKLQGRDVPHVADLLAAGAGKAQGSVHDMGMALNQSGLVAAQFGLSIEDTTGALAEFAHAGLIGSDAGTSLKTMLLALANPSTVTQKRMDSLGISFYDAQGKFIGLSGVAEVLRQRLGGLSDEQRQSTLSQIFGNDAVRAASVLYTDGAKGVETWRSKVNEAGYASQTAAKLTDNLAGDVERLKGSLETLAIQSGSGANSGLRMLAKGLGGVVDGLNAMSPATSGALVVVAGVSGVLLLSGTAWIKYKKTVAEAQEQLAATGPAGERAAAGLGKATSALGKVGTWAAAAAAAGLLFENLDGKTADVDRLTASLTNLADTGKSAGELKDVFGSDFDGLGRIAMFAESADHGFGHFVNGVANSIPIFGDAGKQIGNFGSRLIAGTDWDTAKQQMSSLDQALTSYMNTIQDARKASDLWNRVQSQSGLDAKQLADLLPNTYKAVGQLNTQADKAGVGVKALGSATSGTTGKLGDLNSALAEGTAQQKPFRSSAEMSAAAARGERDALEDLANQIKKDTDPVFALLSAQDGLTQAQKEATKATREHGKGSDQARTATRKLAEAALDLELRAGQLGGEFDGKLTPAFRATLKSAGLTNAQIAAVSAQFREAKKDGDKFAGNYAANVSAPGAKQAKRAIDLAYTSANGFAGPYVASVAVEGDVPARRKLDRLAELQQALKSGKNISTFNALDKKGFATGGWTGPGSKYDPAGVVHADEFVVQKSSRGSLEQQKPGALDYMNQTGRWPGYAGGGLVSWPYPVDASKTKIPSKSDVMNAVLPAGGGAGPGGGQTYHWILDVVHQAFPGLHATSTFRKNAVTLSGNRSYHAVGRAVDWPPSKPLAEWVNANYFRATRELITPWQSLNIKNGSRHAYSGEIYAQHAGLGRWKGNAHDHWAMARGGVIPEHVIGVGRSGRTYEFGEHGPETVIPGYASGGLVNVAPRAAVARSGSRLGTYDAMLSAANAVAQLTAALKENGRSFSYATQKGRDNRASLIAGVRAAQDAAKAKYDETGSIKAANKVYDEYLHKLDQSLKKMHVNAATRRALIKAYSEKPTYDVPAGRAPSNSSMTVRRITDQIGAEDQLANVKSAFAWTKPSFNIKTETGRSEFQTLFSYLSAAQQAAQSLFEAGGNSKQATALYNSYMGQLRSVLSKAGMSKAEIDKLFTKYGRITLTPATANRWGGVYEHAATGSLRDAQIASGGPTRYAWAEPATGGEAFIPKNGNPAKSLAAWQYVGRHWLNQSVGQTAGARRITVQATIPIQLGAELITRQVQFEVDAAMGQVVNATVYQTA